MQPKPCAKTKQQDHGIKTLFEKLRIKDSPEVQQNIINMMMDTNKKTLEDWREHLEDNHQKKTSVRQDIARFEQ